MNDVANGVDETVLDQALAAAHLPALLMATIHLTGDASLLTPERRPSYVLFADGNLGGYAEEVQADIRRRAKSAIKAHLAGAPLPPPPAPATARKMMDWAAGVDIPEAYADFLNDELALYAADTKKPDWSSPKLKAAAAKTKAIIVGAGMSG